MIAARWLGLPPGAGRFFFCRPASVGVLGFEHHNRGEPILDDTFLVLFHAAPEDVAMKLPGVKWGAAWYRVFDTDRGFAPREGEDRIAAGGEVNVTGRSLWLLKQGPA